jgi:DNA-binding protein HU-beta
MIPHKVNKSFFIELLAARLDTTPHKTEQMVNKTLSLVYELLKEGHTVNIQGFGQFSLSRRRSRIGVNPRQPDQKITLPELHTPKFKAGETLKAIARTFDEKGKI